jgi:hypothetical protein
MTGNSKTKRALPAGWNVVNNPDFVTPIDGAAKQFADRVESYYKTLHGLFTRSDTEVLLMERTPESATLTRARTMLRERGYRCSIRWLNENGVSSLEVEEMPVLLPAK